MSKSWFPSFDFCNTVKLVGRVGLEPTRCKRLIYSQVQSPLCHLPTRTSRERNLEVPFLEHAHFIPRWVRRGSRNVVVSSWHFLTIIRTLRAWSLRLSICSVRQWFHHWVRRRESHPNFQGHNLASCLLDDDRHTFWHCCFKTVQQRNWVWLCGQTQRKILVSNRLLECVPIEIRQVMGEIRIGSKTSS